MVERALARDPAEKLLQRRMRTNTEAQDEKKVRGETPLTFLNNLLKTVFCFELVSTTATFHLLLSASEEWMAFSTNFKTNFFFSRLCLEVITTCAMYFYLIVIRMDSFLHEIHLFLKMYEIVIWQSPVISYTHIENANPFPINVSIMNYNV